MNSSNQIQQPQQLVNFSPQSSRDVSFRQNTDNNLQTLQTPRQESNNKYRKSNNNLNQDTIRSTEIQITEQNEKQHFLEQNNINQNPRKSNQNLNKLKNNNIQKKQNNNNNIKKSKSKMFKSSGTKQGYQLKEQILNKEKDEENQKKILEIEQKAKQYIAKARYLGIMEKIRKNFVDLLNNTNQRKFNFLETKHFELINDVGFDHAELLKLKQKKSCIGKLTYGFALVFGDYIDVCLICSLVVTTIGSFIRLHSGYYDHGKLIEDPEKRLDRYYQIYSLPDLVGFITIIYCLLDAGGPYQKQLALPIFYRIKTLINLWQEQEEILNFTGIMFYIKGLIVLFFQVVAVCHFIGVAYHMLGILENDYLEIENNWLQKINIYDEDWSLRYLESFYWSLATIMLVGSKGETRLEIMFCCMTLISTVGLFATILTKVTQLIDDMDSKSKVYRQQQEVLTEMFNQNVHIKRVTQLQVLNYLKYLNEGHKDMQNSEDVNKILVTFPKDIQNIVKAQKYKVHLKKLKFFSEQFSTETMENILEIIKEEFFMPNQIITNQMDFNQEDKIYLIVKGRVIVQAKMNKKVDEEENEEQQQNSQQNAKKEKEYQNCSILEQGEYFNVQTFYTGIAENIQFKSEDFTTLLTIEKSALLHILNTASTRHDIEIFNKFKHQLLVHGQCISIKQKCYKCGKLSHSYQNCNIVNYTPNYKMIVARAQQSNKIDKRTKYKRREQSISVYLNLEIIKQHKTMILESTELRSYLKALQQTLKESQFQQFQKKFDNFINNGYQRSIVVTKENYGNKSFINRESFISKDYEEFNSEISDTEYQNDRFQSAQKENQNYQDMSGEISLTDIQEIQQQSITKKKRVHSIHQVKSNERRSSDIVGQTIDIDNIRFTKNNRALTQRLNTQDNLALIKEDKEEEIPENSLQSEKKRFNQHEQRLSFQGPSDYILEKNYTQPEYDQIKQYLSNLQYQEDQFQNSKKKLYDQLEQFNLVEENQKCQNWLEFESKHNFMYFYPENNFDRVLEKYYEEEKKDQYLTKYMGKIKKKLKNQHKDQDSIHESKSRSPKSSSIKNDSYQQY